MLMVCALTAAGFGLTVMALYPGYLTNDATFVYGYIHDWQLGDWQSPLMTMVWRKHGWTPILVVSFIGAAIVLVTGAHTRAFPDQGPLKTWIIGLPIGYLLGFRLHHGAIGLWLGLCAGLMVAGTALTTIWHRTTKKLAQITNH